MQISSTTALLASSRPQSNATTSGTTSSASTRAALLPQTQLTLASAFSTGAAYVTQMPNDMADEDLTYDALGKVRLTGNQLQVWEQSPDDAVSQLLARNAGSNTSSVRLSGVGSALLDNLGNGAVNYRQTLANTTAPSSRSQIQAKASYALNSVQSQPSGRLEMQIQTRSGATVTLRIVDQQNGDAGTTGLTAELQVEGPLSAAERTAVQALAEGFERTLQGLASDDPQVDLEKLGQFDSSLITQIDLKANFYKVDQFGSRSQKLGISFSANANLREIKLARPEGEVSMSVDLRQPAFWGSAAQKAKAVDVYLARMDKAAARGHADRNAVELFKSTFSALTASYGALDTQNPGSSINAMRAEDASLLTGLADFKAQLTATSKAINPRRRWELDRFQYTVDQTTTNAGSAGSSRTVAQTQNAHLSAAWHEQLFSQAPPTLDDSPESQNYYYKQLEESTVIEVQLQFDDKNRLIAASLTQFVTQSLRTQKIENDKLQEETSETKSPQPKSTDLMPRIRELRDREDGHDISPQEKQQMLAAWNNLILQEPSL